MKVTLNSTPKALLLVLFLGATLAYLITMDNRQRSLQTSWKQEMALMGTTISVTIRGVDKGDAKKAFIESFKIAQEIDARLSTYKVDSEITALNTHFSISSEPVTLSSKTAFLIESCITYTNISKGTFDVTVKPLINLWRTAKKTKVLPHEKEINDIRPQAYLNGATLSGRTLQAPQGTNFDFGGIGKGYTADAISHALEALGIYNYLIDVGRDLLVRGDDAPWRIAIQHPLDTSKAVQTLIIRSKTAIATSGDYEQQYRIGSKKLTHIIDPRTGWPIKEIAGATVIAPTGTEADALATAFTVLTPSQSIAIANARDGLEILVCQNLE